MQNFAGKVALVTGGASGIGKGIAARLVAEGMTVIIADIEQSVLDQTAAEIGAVGIRADVTDLASVQALADEVERRFGGVDLFCSNAGVGSAGKIADMKSSDWEWLLGVNLWGTIHGLKAFTPLLSANPNGGYIVVTASEAGFHVPPGLGGYSITKFAVIALAEAAAQEMEADGLNIGLTILCPGPVQSKLGSSQRNRPGQLAEGGLIDSDFEKTEEGARLRWITPEAVSEAMVHAIGRGDLYAFTHPEMAAPIAERHKRIAQALAHAATQANK